MILSRSTVEIKKADKSNTFVIMNKQDYKDTMVLKGHLETPTYEKVGQNVNQNVFKGLIELCNKHSACITDNERKVILNKEWSESHFYVLSKIHKSKDILTRVNVNPMEYMHMPFPKDLKGRIINGDVKSVTQGISKMVEKILKQLASSSSEDFHQR